MSRDCVWPACRSMRRLRCQHRSGPCPDWSNTHRLILLQTQRTVRCVMRDDPHRTGRRGMTRFGRIGSLALLAGLLATAGWTQPAAAQGTGSSTLDAVRARGQMLCGTAGQVPGFSLPDSQGVMRGLDADSCRAVTAAALGDVSKVKFVAT